MATKPANQLAASSAPFVVAVLAFIFSVIDVVGSGTATVLNGCVLLLTRRASRLRGRAVHALPAPAHTGTHDRSARAGPVRLVPPPRPQALLDPRLGDSR